MLDILIVIGEVFAASIVVTIIILHALNKADNDEEDNDNE